MLSNPSVRETPNAMVERLMVRIQNRNTLIISHRGLTDPSSATEAGEEGHDKQKRADR